MIPEYTRRRAKEVAVEFGIAYIYRFPGAGEPDGFHYMATASLPHQVRAELVAEVSRARALS
jgi:hypothetical protein